VHKLVSRERNGSKRTMQHCRKDGFPAHSTAHACRPRYKASGHKECFFEKKKTSIFLKKYVAKNKNLKGHREGR
jgi:hypothetical protein